VSCDKLELIFEEMISKTSHISSFAVLRKNANESCDFKGKALETHPEKIRVSLATYQG
jgi:hypothetical protein